MTAKKIEVVPCPYHAGRFTLSVDGFTNGSYFKLESFMGYSLTELVAIINQHKQAGASAAGSAERQLTILLEEMWEVKNGLMNMRDAETLTPTKEEWIAAKRNALAGTDTDVAKEK